MKQKKKMSLIAKQSAAGWAFLTPATILIAIMAFWPMIQAFIMSLQTGSSANMHWNEPIFNNYTRMFSDKVFMTSVVNTFLYLIIQVPIMLILAILLAQLLNNQHLNSRDSSVHVCSFPVRQPLYPIQSSSSLCLQQTDLLTRSL